MRAEWRRREQLLKVMGIRGGESTSKGRIGPWLIVCASFVVASGVQIFMYGGPRLWGGHEPMFNVSEQLYLPLVLFFFFGPGVIAASISLALLRAAYRRQAMKLPTRVIVVVFGMTLLSCYVGVFVSFNAWGT